MSDIKLEKTCLICGKPLVYSQVTYDATCSGCGQLTSVTLRRSPVDKETERPSSAVGKNAIWPVFGFLFLVMVAMPLYCSFNSGKKSIKMTNEDIILDWRDKIRMGKNINRGDSAQPIKTTGGQTIREDQIKDAARTDGGWVVTTKENRMHFIPKTGE